MNLHASDSSPDPTPDQLTAMAYVDGELPGAEREEFEARLATDPSLALEVASLQRLAVLARHMAPPEPADAEWKRIARDPLHRSANHLGFALLLVSAAGLIGFSFWTILTSDLVLATKALLAAGMGGLALLLFTTLRARLRVLPYDPYTHIER